MDFFRWFLRQLWNSFGLPFRALTSIGKINLGAIWLCVCVRTGAAVNSIENKFYWPSTERLLRVCNTKNAHMTRDDALRHR